MENALGFIDLWIWLIFVGFGLFLVLLELLVGVDTGLDMVFVGSTFILGGLVTWPAHSWVWTLVITAVICVVYVVVGRRYIHRWTAVRHSKTNVDTIVGQTGIVLQNIARSTFGIVKVGNEEWRARAEEAINEGDEITVTGISGVTLNVEKTVVKTVEKTEGGE